MCTENGGLRAIGVDVAKYLPGLYWLNFFGFPYEELIGEQRLASAPAFQVGACGLGYIVMLSKDCHAWDAPETRLREESVRRHLGERYFFDRNQQLRETISPFNLPKLPANNLRVEADIDVQNAVREIRIRQR
jgi:hypothetical protein